MVGQLVKRGEGYDFGIFCAIPDSVGCVLKWICLPGQLIKSSLFPQEFVSYIYLYLMLLYPLFEAETMPSVDECCHCSLFFYQERVKTTVNKLWALGVYHEAC